MNVLFIVANADYKKMAGETSGNLAFLRLYLHQNNRPTKNLE